MLLVGLVASLPCVRAAAFVAQRQSFSAGKGDGLMSTTPKDVTLTCRSELLPIACGFTTLYPATPVPTSMFSMRPLLRPLKVRTPSPTLRASSFATASPPPLWFLRGLLPYRSIETSRYASSPWGQSSPRKHPGPLH